MGATSPPTVTRQAGTSRSVSRRIRRRLSVSHMAIGLAVALAFTLNYLALQDRGATQLIAVADRSLVAGSPVSSSDIRLVPIPSDFSAMDSLISESTISRYEGWILKHEIAEGELIGVSSLVEPGAPDGLRSMSIPIPVEHAAGGALRPGDRVDIVKVENGTAAFVVSDVEVLGVAETSSGGLGSIGDYHVVVAVDPEQVLALAEAIDLGSLEVIRATGAHPAGDAS